MPAEERQLSNIMIDLPSITIDNAELLARDKDTGAISKVDGKISNLTQTATEADLVAGNYFALDGAEGTKRLPAEVVAKASDVDVERERVGGSLNFKTVNFVGNNTTFVRYAFTPIASVSYRLSLPTLWSIENVVETQNIFLVDYLDEKGDKLGGDVINVTKARASTLQSEYIISPTADAAYVRLSIRADLGENVSIKYSQIGIEAIKTSIVAATETAVAATSAVASDLNAFKGVVEGTKYVVVGEGETKVETLIPVNGFVGTKKIKFPSIPWDMTGVGSTSVILAVQKRDSSHAAYEVIAEVNKNKVDQLKNEYTIGIDENCYEVRVMIRAAKNTPVTFYFGNYIADQLNDLKNEVTSIEENIPALNDGTYEGEKITIAKKHGFSKSSLVSKTPVLQGDSPSTQGFSVYNDSILVQAAGSGASTKCKLYIYDLVNGMALAKIDFAGTAIAEYHCNSVSLGWKQEESDPIPLIFLSSSLTGERTCAVVRIKSDYTAEIVSILTYVGSKLPSSPSVRSQVDFSFDNTSGNIVVYHPLSPNATYTTKAKVCEFKLPNLSSSVSIDDSMLVAEYETDCVYMHQQLLSAYGKLFALSGNRNNGWTPFVVVIDKGSKQMVSKLSLDDLNEPEGLALFGTNSLVVMGTGFSSYIRFDF